MRWFIIPPEKTGPSDLVNPVFPIPMKYSIPGYTYETFLWQVSSLRPPELSIPIAHKITNTTFLRDRKPGNLLECSFLVWTQGGRSLDLEVGPKFEPDHTKVKF